VNTERSGAPLCLTHSGIVAAPSVTEVPAMLRKIAFVLIALALPLVAASAASAQQYPPTGEEPTPTTTVERTERTGSEAPLPRTGTDVTLLAGVAVVLVAGGAVAMVASRRRTSPA
jgi:hypothetical protein